MSILHRGSCSPTFDQGGVTPSVSALLLVARTELRTLSLFFFFLNAVSGCVQMNSGLFADLEFTKT